MSNAAKRWRRQWGGPDPDPHLLSRRDHPSTRPTPRAWTVPRLWTHSTRPHAAGNHPLDVLTTLFVLVRTARSRAVSVDTSPRAVVHCWDGLPTAIATFARPTHTTNEGHTALGHSHRPAPAAPSAAWLCGIPCARAAVLKRMTSIAHGRSKRVPSQVGSVPVTSGVV